MCCCCVFDVLNMSNRLHRLKVLTWIYFLSCHKCEKCNLISDWEKEIFFQIRNRTLIAFMPKNKLQLTKVIATRPQEGSLRVQFPGKKRKDIFPVKEGGLMKQQRINDEKTKNLLDVDIKIAKSFKILIQATTRTLHLQIVVQEPTT